MTVCALSLLREVFNGMQWDRSPASTVGFSPGSMELHLKMIVRLKERTLLCSAAPFNYLQKSGMTLPVIHLVYFLTNFIPTGPVTVG